MGEGAPVFGEGKSMKGAGIPVNAMRNVWIGRVKSYEAEEEVAVVVWHIWVTRDSLRPGHSQEQVAERSSVI